MDATVVDIAGDGDRRRPLLDPSGEIHPYPESPSPQQPPGTEAKPEQQQKPQRVASLDVFRGLTVAMMILVDDAGGAWPGINHAPWFGVTVADFVMPGFLFIIGVSAALVFKKTPNKTAATKKAAIRAIKLFILGVILQGGYIHGRHSLTYGVDLDHIRWLGVLQRIAIGYFLAAISEIWLVNNILVDSPVSFVKKYFMEWIMAIMISALYVGLVFGLYVSNWEFKVQTSNSSLSTPSNEVGIKMYIDGCSDLLCWSYMPFSKPLYTVSYLLLTGVACKHKLSYFVGVSGFLLLLLYCIVMHSNLTNKIITKPLPAIAVCVQMYRCIEPISHAGRCYSYQEAIESLPVDVHECAYSMFWLLVSCSLHLFKCSIGSHLRKIWLMRPNLFSRPSSIPNVGAP